MKLESALSRVVLPGAGAAADEDAAALRHRGRQRLQLALGQRPRLDQLPRAGPADAEAADREDRPVDRQRRDHDVDPRAVGEPGVDHRAQLVDPSPERSEDPLDRVPQLLLVGKPGLGGLDPPAALDEDGLGAVDHHLLDRGIGEQVLERSEADGVAEDPGDHRVAVGVAEQGRLPVDQCAHLELEALRGAGAARGLRPPSLDQPRAQRGRELLAVALPRPQPPPAGSSVTRRAKLSAAISRRAWGLVRPSVAVAVSPGSEPSRTGLRARSGTRRAAT